MYLVVIAWMYVVLMMSIAEATNTTGSLLGAIVTFVLYGLLPLSLVVYLMNTPNRKRAIRAREAAEDAERRMQQAGQATTPTPSVDPDAGGHAAGAAEPDSVAPVGKEL